MKNWQKIYARIEESGVPWVRNGFILYLIYEFDVWTKKNVYKQL